jgi:hypothetical protein
MTDDNAAERRGCWVLLRYESDSNGPSTVMGVYESHDDLLARIERVRKANSQYPLTEIRPNWWTVGPEDDEGFFGNRPVYLKAVEAKFHPVHSDSRRDAT